MKFPTKSLIPKGGSIYGHIFENRLTGVKRDLYWSFTVDFKPIQYGEHKNKWKCSMTCEWITWPIRDWRKLYGKHIRSRYGENGVESSFYMAAHHIGNHTDMSLELIHSNTFHVQMAMSVNFDGNYGNDREPRMHVKADVEIPFDGIFILPDNLSPAPKTKKDAVRIASEFLDLDTFQPMKKAKGKFHLQPIW